MGYKIFPSAKALHSKAAAEAMQCLGGGKNSFGKEKDKFDILDITKSLWQWHEALRCALV